MSNIQRKNCLNMQLYASGIIILDKKWFTKHFIIINNNKKFKWLKLEYTFK